MKLQYIIGVLAVLLFACFAALNLKQSLTPYVPFSVARQKGTTVQIKGARIAGSETYSIEEKTFNFQIADENGEVLNVHYHGVKPSNFEQVREVVAVGCYHDGVFEAEALMVKCPSKYEEEALKNIRS